MNARNILVLLIMAGLTASPACGFNITRILDQHPEFGNFNSLLSRTGVASAINSRQTITVLALDDSQSARINGLSSEAVAEIMAIHVALDYYDQDQFAALAKNGSAVMTSLYQTTGKSNGGEGFVNVSVHQGQVKFASMAHGAQPDSQLVRVVAAQPYNISVVQVSSPIVPPGLAQLGPAGAPAPRKVGPPPPPPSPSPPTAAPSPDAESPSDDNSPTPSPSPSEAPSPSSDAPADVPSADDYPEPDSKKKSAGIRVLTSSGLLLVAAALAALVAL